MARPASINLVRQLPAVGRGAVLMLSGSLVLAMLVDAPAATATAATRSVARPARVLAPRAVVSAKPDRFSAQLAAVAQGSAVEVLNERTAYTSLFANPDDSFSVQAWSGPQRVRRADGTWADIDTTLQVRSGGAVRPIAAAAQITLSNGGGVRFAGGNRVAATVTTPGDPASLAADAAAVASASNTYGVPVTDTVTGPAVSMSVGWSSPLPTPTLSGNIATYSNVAPRTDLAIRVLPRGVETLISLTSRPSVVPALGYVITLPLHLSGLTAVATADGGVAYRSTSGLTVGAAGRSIITDSSVDTASGQPVRQISVSTTVLHVGARTSLAIRVPASLLNDPATVWPVVVDPSHTAIAQTDTYVEQGYNNTNFGTSTTLKVGTYDAGVHVARSYVVFPLTGVAGFHSATTIVDNASLHLYEWWADSCTKAPMYVRALTESFSESGTTWANKPGQSSDTSHNASDAHRNDSSGACAQGWFNGSSGVQVTSIAQTWARNSNANWGVALTASETTNSGWKQFYSSDWSNSGAHPYLIVSFHHVPATPTAFTVTPYASGWVNTTTPQLSATVSDLDGGTMLGRFRIYDGTTLVWGADSTSVPSGGTVRVTVPDGVLTKQNTVYTARVYGVQNSELSATPAETTFRIDTTAPAAPTITSTGYDLTGGWTIPNPTSNTFTFTPAAADTDVLSWRYRVDGGDWTRVEANANGVGTLVMRVDDGVHTLEAYAVDRAWSNGAITLVRIKAGYGYINSPVSKARTQRFTLLQATAAPGHDYVSGYEIALGETGNFTTVPVSDLTFVDSTTHPAYPIQVTNTLAPMLDWDVRASVARLGGADGLVQVRACLGVTPDDLNPVCVDPVRLQLNTATFGGTYATTAFGPGTLSLTTGDMNVDSTDVSIAGLSVTRSLTTLVPSTVSGAAAVFGPGWTPGWTPGVGAAASTLADHRDVGYLTLTDADKYQIVYRLTGPDVYSASGEARDGSYISPSGAALVLHSIDGSTTTFELIAGRWVTTLVTDPGQNNTTTYGYDATGRVVRILAPVEAGITCSATTTFNQAGCRALIVHYATATTASGDSPAGWGTFLNQVDTIDYRAYDPTSASVQSVAVAKYLYDTTGRLRGQNDPRITPPLTTTYTYGTDSRLTQVTAPGLNPSTLTYDTSHRVVAVTRTDPEHGPATVRAVYEIGLTTATGPLDLVTSGADDPATWGQDHSLPADGTVIFPASHPLTADSSGDYIVGAADWSYGDVWYYDVYSRVVNTATFGANQWLIDSTQYDTTDPSDPRTVGQGNITWTLDAADRAEALNPTDASNSYVHELTTSAARADALATEATYDQFGNTLTSTGPTHDVTLASGQVASARNLTTNVYDQNAPATGGPYYLVTQTTTAPQLSTDQAATPAADDTRTTRVGYDPIDGADPVGPTSGWTLRQPTTSTIVMDGAADITTSTVYDNSGRVLQTRQPSDPAGGGAGTTLTVYYTTAPNPSHGSCGGKPQWAGWECGHGPAAQPAGAPVPVTGAITYDRYGQNVASADTSGSDTITSTNTYDPASGRLTATAISGTGPTIGAAVPTQSFGYSTTTGALVTTTTSAGTVTSTYDSLGRMVGQTDGTAPGGTTTTTYTIDGQVASVANAKGTTTYLYDQAPGEHRGLVTSIDAGLSGFGSLTSAVYDAGGTPTITYPNGVTQTSGPDVLGQLLSKTYTDSAGTALVSWNQAFTAFGQLATAQGPSSQGTRSQLFGYDPAGRLTTVNDTLGPVCTSRVYGFDVNSNRTSLAAYTSSDATCPSPSGTATTSRASTFDTFDRATNTTVTGATVGSGDYVYDPFGRVITQPSIDTVGTGTGNIALGYFRNDLAHTQTQGDTTRTFSLDALQRLASWTDQGPTSTSTTVQHYDTSSDAPSWSATTIDGVATWNASSIGPDGNLALAIKGDGVTTTPTTVTLNLVSPHGDVFTTIPDIPDVTVIDIGAGNDTDEYGITLTPQAPDYGWVGAKLKTTNTSTGLIQMGVRLYNPGTGRFLTTDPVPGGNANTYTYPCDPLMGYDLSGQWNFFSVVKNVGTVASFLVFVPGLGEVAGSVALACAAVTLVHDAYLAKRGRGKWSEVGWDLLDFVPGAGTKALKVVRPLLRANKYAYVASRFPKGLAGGSAAMKRARKAAMRAYDSGYGKRWERFDHASQFVGDFRTGYGWGNNAYGWMSR